jgi:hypothetical protein
MPEESTSITPKLDTEEEMDQGTPLPSNLVEVETPSEKWKTEFENEISSLRINGEDVSKIHRAMTQLREMKNSSDRTLRRMIILVAILVFTGLGVGLYALDYLLQFNAEKIDRVLDLNLKTVEKNREGMFKISTKAFPLLEMHPNKFIWDNNLSRWTILNPQTGIRSDLNNNYMLYSLEGLKLLEDQLGVTWNGEEWEFPNGYLPSKVIEPE